MTNNEEKKENPKNRRIDIKKLLKDPKKKAELIKRCVEASKLFK